LTYDLDIPEITIKETLIQTKKVHELWFDIGYEHFLKEPFGGLRFEHKKGYSIEIDKGFNLTQIKFGVKLL